MPATQRDAPRKRAALYLRMSLDRTGEGAGVERQESSCRVLAEARGWDVVRVYVDNSVSASKGIRPQWEQLLEGARAGSFDLVVAWALDRLVRRSSDLERLVETGVQAATVQGDLDLTTPQGELIGGILASVARAEVRQKGERQRAANLQRAQAGIVGWTRRPFGYDREDSRVVAVPTEAEALRRAAQIVLDGGTLAAAARSIDSAGLTTTAGKPWNVTTLRRALLNPRYAGRAVSKGEDHGVGDWPVLLDASTQARLEDALRDPARRTQLGTTIRHLLSGLATCGRCGGTMTANPMKHRGEPHVVYRCRTCFLSRKAAPVDDFVSRVTVARLSQPDAAELLVPDVDRDRLHREAVDLRRRRDELAELLADGLLSGASVRGRAKELGDRLRNIEQALGAAGERGPLAELAHAEDAAEAWRAMDVRARRTVISELMQVRLLPAGRGARAPMPEIVWRSHVDS